MPSRLVSPLCLLLLGALAGTTRAGGTPENAIVIIDPTSAVSMQIGNHYVTARNIPETNVVYLRSAASNYAEFVAYQQRALQASINQRTLSDHADYIVVAPCDTFFVNAPNIIDDPCFPITRFSISAAYTMSFISQEVLGHPPNNLANGYAGATEAGLYFDSNNGYSNGLITTSSAGRRYYIGALLGWTGSLGNTPQEIMTMIDRSVAVEGTRPAGSFYFMNNTGDAARNVRQPLFASAISGITTRSGTATQLNGVLPNGRINCLGIMTGAATLDFTAAGITILPGAFGDHLTSYAATFDLNDQTKMSQWIARGCSGTAGTVEEPCNYPFKFPVPRLHTWYFQGLSLGESYLRSMAAVPFQNLLLGDPLTRPFARIPVVTVSGLPASGTIISGPLTLTPNATTTLPGGTITTIEILVDGVLRATVNRNTPFTLDTRTLDDGHHDIRFIARDTSPIRNMGRHVSTFTTRNYFRSAGLTVSSSSGSVNQAFDFTPTATGGTVGGVRLLHNGRVVASSNGIAPLQVFGSNLGAGIAAVRAEVIFADGRVARSAPVQVTVTTEPPGPHTTPVAFPTTIVAPPGSTRFVELPASFRGDASAATFAVLNLPAGFTMAGSGPSRLLTTPTNMSGPATFSFNVQTSAGTSNTATLTLLPATPPICPADFNVDGVLSPDDLDDFIGAYFTTPQEARLDVNADGLITPDDLDDFVNTYFDGC